MATEMLSENLSLLQRIVDMIAENIILYAI